MQHLKEMLHLKKYITLSIFASPQDKNLCRKLKSMQIPHTPGQQRHPQ